MTHGLIIGGGPAGLTLACELIQRGVKPRIFEELLEPQAQSRALGLQSRTLEIFEKMGLIEQFLSQGKIVRGGNFYHNGKHIASIDFSHVKEVAYPFVLSLPQEETEKILIKRLHELGGVVERGLKLIDLSGIPNVFQKLAAGNAGAPDLQSPKQAMCEHMVDGGNCKDGDAGAANSQFLNHVRYKQATFQKSDGSKETITAPWIFGCDGAHSTVRHSLKVPFEGAPFPEIFALADCVIELPLKSDEIHFFFNEGIIAGLVPLTQPHCFRLISIMSNTPIDNPPPLDITLFQQWIDRCAPGYGIQIKTVSWMSYFTAHRRIVPHMRAGNVFLLGDAAHIHSPAGGQGLNTSVQDAYNLAWKFALVHSGKAHESLLDSFEEERLPVALKVLKGTSLVTEQLGSPFFKKFILPIFGRIVNWRFFQKRIFNLISELKISYKPSAIIGEPRAERNWDAPKAGCRAPDVLYLPNDKRLFSYFSQQHHTLLCFGGRQWQPLIDAATKAVPGEIEVYHISSTQTGDGIIYDPIKAIADTYAAHFPCLYLIRPDGMIGYRTRSCDPQAFLAYLGQLFKF